MSIWKRLTRIGRMALGDDFPDTPPGFAKDYQQAGAHGCFCSRWGTCKYYIDKDHDMYVGAGELEGRLYDAIGDGHAHELNSVTFVEPVRAPTDSSYLFAETDEIYINEPVFFRAVHGLDKVDTSHVQDMQGMFANDCFLESLDLSSWDTRQVQDMSFMFHHLSRLRELDVSNWDTSNVVDMRKAFAGTSRLETLDLHHWRTEKVTDMSWMFTDTSRLRTLDLSNFEMSQVQDQSAMFLWMNDRTIIEMSPSLKHSQASLEGIPISNKKKNINKKEQKGNDK